MDSQIFANWFCPISCSGLLSSLRLSLSCLFLRINGKPSHAVITTTAVWVGGMWFLKSPRTVCIDYSKGCCCGNIHIKRALHGAFKSQVGSAAIALHTFAHMLARVFMLEHPMHINPQAYRVVDQQSQLQAHKVSTSTRLVVVRATFQDVNVVGAGANEDALHAQQIKKIQYIENKYSAQIWCKSNTNKNA